ncbi:MAG: proprotein convertase P-domain-containing protein [Pirellulales bacterium]
MQTKKRRGSRLARQYWVERLEERYLMTASGLWTGSGIDLGAIGTLDSATAQALGSASGASLLGDGPIMLESAAPRQLPTGAALAVGADLTVDPADAPYPLEDTFALHSLPGATKVIYLDFDGFTTRNTAWNDAANLPNIITPAWDTDGDLLNFGDDERLSIQQIWERVAEDYRPFNVDVTTEDPGVEALRNTGGADDQWGIRVVIGGSVGDWYGPTTGSNAGGVAHLNSFTSSIDDPAFVFGADYGIPIDIAEAVSHEAGHTLGLVHDGQFRFYKDTADEGKIVRLYVNYYPGHGTGETSWAPIMGVSYGMTLTQWSKGEYFNATNDSKGEVSLQDDLAVITTGNGFDYRPDDHGSTVAEAEALTVDPDAPNADIRTYTAEGIIERNTDVDYFSFTVEALGELVSFDIQPFYNGPNLDVLAKVYDAAGNVVATGNSIDEIGVTFTDLALEPGTYYVSVQGDGRPITFIDPAFHPDLPEAEGNPPDPPLDPDTSDWGYSNYGSLGYYSIVATQKKALVVGVDFDVLNGNTPENWNLYGGEATLTDLISETGAAVPYELEVSSTGNTITPHASTVDTDQLPTHGVPLDELGGYISTSTDTWTFTWTHLEPWSFHQVYVFGHADVNAVNNVTITGGNLNGTIQTINFTQTISADGLYVNGKPGTDDDLTTFAYTVLSDGDGKIQITVTPEQGSIAALAGLAIAATQPVGPPENGSISGQKWNDLDGDRTKDQNEVGLPGWTIYLDENNNGILDTVTTPQQTVTVPAPVVPQPLTDNATTKNELFFSGNGVVSDINVTLDINHTYDSDLDVYLISPSGTRVKLFADIGGAGDHFHGTTLDDAAATGIAQNSAPFTGTFRPQEPLSVLNGQQAHGTWQLEITDDSVGDTGVLNSWSVTITTPGSVVFLEPTTVTDADGNYSFADLPAGLYHVREYFTAQQIFDQWVQTLAPTPITVTSAADVQNVDFGNWIAEFLRGSIQGQKFADANANGVKESAEAGLAGWTVYLDANANGLLDSATTPTTISSTEVPRAIDDNVLVSSNLTVGAIGSVYKVEVTLDITHSFVGDLRAFLISPSGKSVKLFDGVGGQFNNFQSLTLSDTAARSITTLDIGDVPYTGTWRPEGLLSDMIGENAAGTWTLQILDQQAGDEGFLNSWSLKITPGEFTQVTDADGNYSFDDLTPGTYIVREVPQSGWSQIAPATPSITGATFANSQWTVTIVGQDSQNPSNPNEPLDSRRNVKNVNFGNKAAALPGDYNGSAVVDASDFVLWRKRLGTPATPAGSGADGNANGTVDAGDYTVWRSHFGQTAGAGSGSSAVLASGGSLAAAPLSPDVTEQPVSLAATRAEAAVAEPLAVSAGAELPSGIVRTLVRPTYRPSAVVATSSDEALLAWLADSHASVVDQQSADLVAYNASTDDVETVDSAFGELETVLAGSGSVL